MYGNVSSQYHFCKRFFSSEQVGQSGRKNYLLKNYFNLKIQPLLPEVISIYDSFWRLSKLILFLPSGANKFLLNLFEIKLKLFY